MHKCSRCVYPNCMQPPEESKGVKVNPKKKLQGDPVRSESISKARKHTNPKKKNKSHQGKTKNTRNPTDAATRLVIPPNQLSPRVLILPLEVVTDAAYPAPHCFVDRLTAFEYVSLSPFKFPTSVPSPSACAYNPIRLLVQAEHVGVAVSGRLIPRGRL